jgi:NDP-sugar pyrophosphorylase family protein
LKALVLAAGQGSRLRPLTLDRPKPMIEIAGAPILEHNVRRLVSHGFTQIVINLHYLPDTIEDYFGNGSRFGATISYSFEDELLGTAGALKKVEDRFQDDDFLVIYGDNLTTCDFSDLMRTHRAKQAILTMALHRREDPRSSGIVGLDNEGRITRFLEKPSVEQVFSQWVNAGALALSPAILDVIPAGRFSDFGRDILDGLVRGGYPIYGYQMDGRIWWIDSLEDYQATRAAFEDGPKAELIIGRTDEPGT